MEELIEFEKFKEFWERDPVVVIDSCSLLDLYRYSPKASKRILNNLKEIADYIWLPGQVIEEYNRNKESVIRKANKKYENVMQETKGILYKANNDITSIFNSYGKFSYPKVNTLKKDIEDTVSTLMSRVLEYKDAVASEIKDNKKILKEDEVQGFIQILESFDQLGVPFSLTKMIEIYKEGEIRYRYLIPPGYKDVNKGSDKNATYKFGDLIIWKEILQKAADNPKPFIFITDDVKEDWWEIEKKNTHLGEQIKLVRPRSELVSEFEDISQIGEDGFLMLTLPEFNKHISIINEIGLKEIYFNDLDISAEKILMEIIEKREWASLLTEQANIEHEFAHGGELQELCGQIISDIEINDISNPEFENLFVDYEDDNVIIESGFRCVAWVNIETSLSKEINHMVETRLVLSGNITLECSIEFNRENSNIDRSNEEINISNIEIIEYEQLSDEIDYSDIACIICQKWPASYFTYQNDPICIHCSKNLEVCPRCGLLFEEGTLNGNMCDKCEVCTP